MVKIVFLGAPGSGKGTYSERISPKLGVPHISTGDIFREAVAKGTELGKKVKEYLESGSLVPDEITIQVLKERISQPDCEKGFILDGFPRTLEQAKALDQITDIDIVILLNLPEELIVKKLAGRRVCEKCGKIYNVADISYGKLRLPPMLPKNPEGVCDECGGRLVQREDDKEEVIRERLKVYHELTEPIIEYYKNQGKLVTVEVDAPADEMAEKILKIIREKTGKE